MDHNQDKTCQELSGGKRWLCVLQFFVTIALIAGGIYGARLLIKSKKEPVKMDQPKMSPVVEVEKLVKRDIVMTVRGYGTVKPKVQVEIVPQVSGNIVFVHEQFKPGGFIKSGEIILKIDPRDYELEVQQAKALVADALVKLDLQKAEAQVAKLEWQQLNPDKEPPSALVFREPYVRQAEASLESGRAILAKAELNLERSNVRLPVDVVVVSEKVDLGQYAGIGQSVGAAYGIDLVEIEVPLDDRELSWLEIPSSPAPLNGKETNGKQSTALVRCEFAGREQRWSGHVTRTTGQIDTTSRLVSVVVEVADPFSGHDGRAPLVPGMFVEVIIEGSTLRDTIAVPREAVHIGNKVWIIKNNTLHIKQIEIVRTDDSFAYTTSVLDNGDDIVISSLDAAVEGMSVRTETKLTTKPVPAEADSNGYTLKGSKRSRIKP